MKDAIRECMRGVTTGPEGVLRASFCFPASFCGFQGHFPAKPVLPGVCTILAAVVLLEEGSQTPLELREVVTAKFLATIPPEATVEFECRPVELRDSERKIRAVARCSEQRVADLTLLVAQADKA